MAESLTDKSKIHIIINRGDSFSGVSTRSLVDSFGDRLLGTVRSAGREIVESVNQGKPVVIARSDAPVARDPTAIARQLIRRYQVEAIQQAREIWPRAAVEAR